MLRRQSTKSRSDVHHRRSASPVHGVQLEHLNAAVAQRDATAAACQAFTRAIHERSSADLSLFPPPLKPSPPRRAQTDNTGLNKYGRYQNRSSHEDSQELRRQQSVRFVRPDPTQTRDGKVPRTAHPVPSDAIIQGEDSDPYRAPTNSDLSSSGQTILKAPNFHLEIEQPQPHRRPPPPPVPSVGISAVYLDAVAAEQEMYTPEDDIASSPSSYRRLRRSRSMFTSGMRSHLGEMSSASNSATAPKRLPISLSCRFLNADHNKENIQPDRGHSLRAPKSMSYLRSRRSGNGTCTSQEFPDEKAYLHEPKEDLVAPKSSFLFGSKGRNKELRKSLRRTSVNNVSTSVGVPGAINPTKDDSLKSKARKVSKSWKLKLKGLLGLSKSEDDALSFPNQHISASKTHVSESFGSIHSQEYPISYSRNEKGSLRRVSSKRPSLHAVPSNQSLRSRKGSLETSDERKVSDDKSLTSWTHSGPSTLTSEQQREWRDWEKQRLSVIRENGTHAPSPSLHRPGVGMQALASQTSTTVQPILPGPTIDSQRIYSALMTRLHETKQLAQVVEQQRKSSEEREDHSKTKFSLEPPTIEGQPISPTIRCVVPEGDHRYSFRSRPGHVSMGEQESNPQMDGDVDPFFKPGSTYPEDFQRVQRDRRALLSPPTHLVPPTGDLDTSPSRARVDRPSAFFGSPTSHLFRTTSPYRRALQKSMEEEGKSIRDREPLYESSSDNGTEICRRNPSGGMLKEVSTTGHSGAYTESLYSRGSEDYGKKSVSFADDDPSTLGDATMNPDPPVTYRPTGHRVDSSVSSIDWKTWLSANVARLEPFSPPTKPSEVEYALPSMPSSSAQGHIRETAQIHEDDDSDSALHHSPPTRKPTLPTTPLSVVEPNVIKTSPFLRSAKRTTPPSTSAARSLPENEDYRTPPPIPMRSLLRPAPSPLKGIGQQALTNTASPHSVGPSVTSSPGLSMAVQRQFGTISTSRYLKGKGTDTRHRVNRSASPGSAPGSSYTKRDVLKVSSTGNRHAAVVSDKSSIAFL